jgi:hypothetical protein
VLGQHRHQRAQEIGHGDAGERHEEREGQRLPVFTAPRAQGRVEIGLGRVDEPAGARGGRGRRDRGHAGVSGLDGVGDRSAGRGHVGRRARGGGRRDEQRHEEVDLACAVGPLVAQRGEEHLVERAVALELGDDLEGVPVRAQEVAGH